MNKIAVILFLLTFSHRLLAVGPTLPLSKRIPAECSSTLLEDDGCDFYDHCLEKIHKCGLIGYPIGYGLRYCKAFTETLSNYSETAVKWIQATRVCLKKALYEADFLADPSTNQCGRIYEHAFASHVDCYIENGFCDAFFYSNKDENGVDKNKGNVLALISTIGASGFLSSAGVRQVYKIIRICMKRGYKGSKQNLSIL